MVLAEIIEEITVEDDPRNVVHRNLHLIRADSPEEAYRKAIELGAAGEASWENVDGKRVTFRGDVRAVSSSPAEEGQIKA